MILKTKLAVFAGFVFIFMTQTSAQSNYTFNVMAPLHVKVYNDSTIEEEQDWIDFSNQLNSVKSIGVDAVTTDVWWGLVEEKGDNEFDWSYYDRLAKTITEQGLRWVPILSFHQCGGNVGDDFSAPLPSWIWSKLVENSHGELSESDFKYVSEETTTKDNQYACKVGNEYRKCSKEYVSLWTDSYVATQYREFMKAFKIHFSNYANVVDEINISCGPAGELRYPSYNSHDGGGYPNRGRLQCYSKVAIQDFQNQMKKKYQSIDKVNQAWNTSLNSFEQITPPDNPNHFFNAQDYKNITYGKDFIDWYNTSLMLHGNRMIQLTNAIFKEGAFANAKIGFKIPGVHWQIGNYYMPRSAEVTAGLLPSRGTGLLCNSSGYETSLKQVLKGTDINRTQLHFTCLEMSNQIESCDDPNNPSPYSMPKALVFWVGEAANRQQIVIKGENALSGNLNSDTDWDNIENAFRYSYYKGITILRIAYVADPNQNAHKRFKQLIHQYNNH